MVVMMMKTKKMRVFCTNAGLSVAILIGLLVFRRFAVRQREMIASRQSA